MRHNAYMSSGNSTVDAMGSIAITGNVIPQTWYKTITRPNGKPYLLACALLADIIYWYRPIEYRDEYNGNVIGWKKRFKGDLLQKSYEQYADFFGESKRTVKAALDHLERIGVIKKIFRNIDAGNNMKLYNVMFIDLDYKKLIDITFNSEKDIQNQEVMNSTKTAESAQTLDCVGGGTKLCRRGNKIMQEGTQNYVPPYTEFCETNTENTTENTTENNSFILSEKTEYETKGINVRNAYEEIVKEQISYNSLMNSDYKFDKAMIDGIINIITDVISYPPHTGTIRIAKREIPYQVVKSKLLKIDIEIFTYALDCIRTNTTEIRNQRAYILTTLYNAADTIDFHFTSKVNHDMAQPEWHELVSDKDLLKSQRDF